MQYQKKATFTSWTSSTSTKEMNQGNALGVFQLGRARGPALISGAIPTLERMSAGPDREGRKGKLFRRRLQPKQAGALGMSAAQKTNSSRPVLRIVRASDGGPGPGQVCKQGANFVGSSHLSRAKMRRPDNRPPPRGRLVGERLSQDPKAKRLRTAPVYPP